MAKKLSTLSNPEKKTITGGSTTSELNQKLKEMTEQLNRVKLEYIDPLTIIVDEPFKSLFNIRPVILNEIVASMSFNGFDENQPVILAVLPDRFVLIDGHTRREASIKCGIKKIPVKKMEFNNEQDALDYAIRLQMHRRNLSDADLLGFIKVHDKLKKRGMKKLGSIDPNLNQGRSADLIAELLGTSASKIKRGRHVEKHASEEQKAAIEAGTKTIFAIYEELKNHKKWPNEDSIKKTSVLKIKEEKIISIINTYRNLLDNSDGIDKILQGRILGIYDLLEGEISNSLINDNLKILCSDLNKY